ncbi:MAG: PepSY domain-containing protein [Nocardioides sp.]
MRRRPRRPGWPTVPRVRASSYPGVHHRPPTVSEQFGNCQAIRPARQGSCPGLPFGFRLFTLISMMLGMDRPAGPALRYGGTVVSTYGYADYPLLAKVGSQGIGLHEGRSLGLLNFWASALFCAAVMFMCVSGPVMWWRRRPKRQPGVARSLGAPRGRLPVKASPLLAVGLVLLGVFLPLFGASLLAVLALDHLLLRRVRAPRAWFNVA